MNKIIKLESVDQYNSLYGLETLHPLVSVVDLTKATKSINHIQMNYGLYALFLKETKSCDIKYGRQYYDYQESMLQNLIFHFALPFWRISHRISEAPVLLCSQAFSFCSASLHENNIMQKHSNIPKFPVVFIFIFFVLKQK